VQAAAAPLRKEEAVRAGRFPLDLDGDTAVAKWPRRSRFLFIVGAAALCWAVPGLAIYLMVAPS
jgi:hypothetical protein